MNGSAGVALALALALAVGVVHADPMTEDEFVSRALSEDDGLAAAAIGMESKSLAWRLGLRRYFPTLSLEIGNDERVAVGALDSFTRSFRARIEQPVWDGGRAGAERFLEARTLASERNAFGRETRTRTEAFRASFRTHIALGMKTAIARSAADAAERQRDLARTELELGLVRELDALDLDVRAAELALAVEEADARLAESKYGLLRAIKADTGADVEFKGTIDVGAPGAELDPDDRRLLSRAVAASPALEAARLDLERLRAEADAAARSWWPTFGVAASVGLSGDGFPLDRMTWSVGFNVDMPEPFMPVSASFNAGGSERERTASWSATATPVAQIAPFASRGERALALARAAEALGEAALDAARDFESKAGAYLRARTSRSLAERRRDLAARRRDLAREILATGGNTRMAYLEAEEALAKAETALVDAALAQWQAERAVEEALDLPAGGLGGALEALGGDHE